MQNDIDPTLIELFNRLLLPLLSYVHDFRSTKTCGLLTLFGKYAKVERMARRVVDDESLLTRHAERSRSYPPARNLTIPVDVTRRYAWFTESWDSDERLAVRLLPERTWSEQDVRNLFQNTIYLTVTSIFSCFSTIVPNAEVIFDAANQQPDSGIPDNLLLLRVYDKHLNPEGGHTRTTTDHPLG